MAYRDPYQFNKALFPGIGSLSPKNKQKASDKPLVKIDIETVEEKKKTVAEQIKNALKGFVGIDYGQGDSELVAVEVKKTLEKTLNDIKPMSYINQVFVVGPNKDVPGADCEELPVVHLTHMVPPAPQDKELNVGLSKLASKDKANKKSKPKKKEKAPAIFQWSFTSNQEVEGQRAEYSTLLREDQSLSCNCPGWIFKKKGEAERSCKHTRAVEAQAKDIHKKWKKGEALPKLEKKDADKESLPGMQVSGSSIGYKRVMDP